MHPNCEYFEDVNWSYSDFFQKLMTVIDDITACKTKPIKENTPDWFNGEEFETISLRDKLFKAFKKARLHIDKELYKKAKYDPLK